MAKQSEKKAASVPCLKLRGRVASEDAEKITLEVPGGQFTIPKTNVQESNEVKEDLRELVVDVDSKIVFETLMDARYVRGVLSRELAVGLVNPAGYECSRCVDGPCECSRCVTTECSRCVDGPCECSRCVDLVGRGGVAGYECSRCVDGPCECSRCVDLVGRGGVAGYECSRCVDGPCECSRCVDLVGRGGVAGYECSRCVDGPCECSRCVDLVGRGGVAGYECSRCVDGPCECSRCVDLAGGWFRRTGAFRRRIA